MRASVDGAMRSAVLLLVMLVSSWPFQPCRAREPEPSTPPGAVTFTDAEWKRLAAMSPAALPKPPPDATNRLADDPGAARLGQELFFDPRFSGRLVDGDNDGKENALGRKGETGKVACSGCHIPGSGFVDTRSLHRQISLAAGWGMRKAISLLDVGQEKLLMWDGRRDALYNQVFNVIESPVEMNSSRLYVAIQLSKRYRKEYETVFGRLPRFDDPREYPQLSADLTGCQPKYADPRPVCDGTKHGMPGDAAEFDHLSRRKQTEVNRAVVNLGKALAAYERRLSCGQGRFDQWMHGDKEALSDSEARGAKLFVGRARCFECHSGPFMSDQKFHNVGLVPGPVATVFRDLDDPGAFAGIKQALEDPLNSRGAFSDGYDGRLPQSAPERLLGAMKTPKLRCVSQRPSFMHTGQVRQLRHVVEFFDHGGSNVGILGKNELGPLGLTQAEKDDLVHFLESLAGPGPPPELLGAPARPRPSAQRGQGLPELP